MPEDHPPRIKLRQLFYNPISLVGLGVFMLCTGVGLPLVLYDVFQEQTNPYAGIMIYALLPGVAMFGALVALAGAILERRRRKRSPGTPVPSLPRIDLNEPRQRKRLVGAMIGCVVIVALLSVTGNQAYHFTESPQFCGEVCHGAMHPEYTAYQHSAHARVACVSCHVGSGAGYFLKSKVTGSYQVYALTFHKYAKPIPSPVKALRPAQETCERCHWPAKFFGTHHLTFTRYLTDEKNTPWQVQMLMKIGGGDPKTAATGGIHWHMNINNDIYYAASDESRQTIPYVKAIDKSGHVTEYMSTESPLSKEDLAKAKLRRMDCMDCHNRPSHIFKSPEDAVSAALAAGQMDASLPYLKREAMRILSSSYESSADGQAAIEKGLPAFYASTYPALAASKASSIQHATRVVQELFAENIFPEMSTDWRAHPNNIGHLNSDGCFRCHDGLHKSADGKVITKECNTCHIFLAQGAPEAIAKSLLQAQFFRHPVDVGMDVKDVKCSTCHNGTTGL